MGRESVQEEEEKKFLIIVDCRLFNVIRHRAATTTERPRIP